MQKPFRALFAYAIALALITVLSPSSLAFAHGDEPRLEISTDRMNPGGVVEVRGVDFEFEELVTLALVGQEYELPLGEIAADTEGIFLQIVTLPTDLKEGVYHFRAVTDDHEILSPALTVKGPPIMSEEGSSQGPREDEDALLAPMPTVAPALPTAAIPALPITEAPAFDWMPITLMLAVLIVMGVAVAFVLRRRGIR